MLNRSQWISFALLTLLSAGALRAEPAASKVEKRTGYDYYVIGNPQSPRPAPTQLGLLLSGGGSWLPDAFRWFSEKAGHGHLVILRASGADDLQHEIMRDVRGFASAQTLVFHDGRPSSDPAVLEIVKNADAIYFGGGDQSRYVRFWQGTPLNAALNAHVKAGKPIGGTSAGLAILGSYSYGCMDGVSLVSHIALTDPTGAHVTLVRNFLNVPFLNNVITDTHFAKRDRLGRLITFVARLAAEDNNPAVTGIGVDEGTILAVDEKGLGRVFTAHAGLVWLVRPMHGPEQLAPNKPLTMSAIPIVTANTESVVDLKNFTIERPAFAFTASVKDGVLIGNERTPAARQQPIPHWSLGVHGGAGVIEKGALTPEKEALYRAGLNKALAAGGMVLRKGGSSLNAVEAAVRVLEDDPLFNAGKGAVFNAEGKNELDAAIMDGSNRKAGAVASVTRTRNPISLARAVMEKSDHVLLAGQGADAFSKLRGLEQVDPAYFRTEARWKQYLEWRATQKADRDRTHLYSTVGAVALDQDGHLAAATSTGGLTGKRWGRIGDSPVIGAGTYAEDGIAAVSATGTGEYFIRTSAARQVRDRVEWGNEDIQDAVDDTIEDIEILGGDGAIMGMDGNGRLAYSMNSIGMYRGWVSSKSEATTAIYADEGVAP